jgi:GntR family transcriptional repressor for pyruvate dehydrogenase complex
MRNHQLVLTWLEAELAAGRLAVGQRLPGERAVAEQLDVSRGSVREGIRVLEAMGIVQAGVGSGPGAGTVVTANPAAALGAALRLHMASSHLPVKDIVQTRMLLESWAAGEADPSSQALVEASRLLDAMDAPQISPEDFMTLDARFHVTLAEAAGNVLIGAMMASIREAIESYTLRLTSGLPDWEQTSARLRAEHRAIHASIRNDGGVAAAAQIRAHIEGFYREAGIGSGE